MEDNHTDVYVIRDILFRSGLNFRLTVFEDGESALDRFNDQAEPCPDLILLDLNIPRVSGIDVLKGARKSNRCPQARVIVVTSSNSSEDREAVERFGGDALFSKPGDLQLYQNLSGLIRRVLKLPE